MSLIILLPFNLKLFIFFHLFYSLTVKPIEDLDKQLQALEKKNPKCKKQIGALLKDVAAKKSAIEKKNTKALCKAITDSIANIGPLTKCLKKPALAKLGKQATQQLKAAKKGGCKPGDVLKLDGLIAEGLKKQNI